MRSHCLRVWQTRSKKDKTVQFLGFYSNFNTTLFLSTQNLSVNWGKGFLFSFLGGVLEILIDSSSAYLKVKVAQSCLTLCDPVDYRVYGILQARILEWVAIPFFRVWSWPRNRTHISCIAGGLILYRLSHQESLTVPVCWQTSLILISSVSVDFEI